MPLLKKKEFRKSKLPSGFRDSEQVFHCVITNEIFRDYDEFCTRVILCNSMVWTCSYTGKSSLTYSEALESENHAKKLFKDFPTELRVPVLFIASKTQRSSFMEMLEDVYGFVKDRYFIGENVEASFTGNKWHESHILQVIAPTPDKLKKSPKNGQAHYGPPATLYHYEVEQMDSEDPDLSEVMIVSYDRIRRTKKIGRDKVKLFLKQYILQNELGVFVVKPSVLEKFGIHKIKFNQIFDGSIPNFNVSKKLTKTSNTKQATLVPFLKHKNDNVSKTKNQDQAANGLSSNSLNLIDKMRKRQEDFIKKKEDLKIKRAADRRRLREENMKISRLLKDWYTPKNDLELEDHKILPTPIPVRTQIPNEHLGDVFSILEFVKTFSKFLSVNNFFPGGLTIDIMERALVEKEVAGPLMDLIQMLLSALFNIQTEEASQCNTKIEYSDLKGRDYNDNVSLTEATYFATSACNWSSIHQGTPLINLPLYSLTTSEILRLHLLSSGTRIHDSGARWRYQYRGGYTSEDDPGLYFRLQHPQILRALSSLCVTELPTGDILKIIDCLMCQLLTYSDVRDRIEDNLEKSKQAKFDYRAVQLSEKKQEQEFMTAKVKIKKECKENKTDPTEQLDKLSKDAENKKAENEKNMKKLMKIVTKHQTHLGQDRAFRKYIKLESIPGLYLNFEENNPGCCYEDCIQQNPGLVNAGRSEVLAHLHKVREETNTSDKENSINTNTTHVNNMVNGETSETSSNKHASNPDELLICNTNPETCMVHSSVATRETWSFFNNPEQITELANSLNSRGILESELKQTIINDQDYFSDLVEKMPDTLNPKLDVPEENKDNDTQTNSKDTKPKGKLKYEEATLGYPKEYGTSLILQYTLVENILDMEEKIFAGNLGSLKVKDRNAWRTSLADYQYDALDKSRKKARLSNKSKEGGRNSRPNTPDLSKKYEDPGKFLGSADKIESSSDNCKESDINDLDNHKHTVECLAFVLAEVAEGIDTRYLKKPLGNVGPKKDTSKIFDILEKWKSSLLASTSYCQIFLHYNTLDNCILWARSALVARCSVCRKGDSENMLVCENCNRGMHLHCNKPKLKSIPRGDWFCAVCRKQKEAEEKLKNLDKKPEKRRRIFVEEEESSDQSDANIGHPRLRNLRKRRKVSTEGGESSGSSDIVVVNGRSGRSRARKMPVPIIEESTEESESGEEQEDDAKDETENSDVEGEEGDDAESEPDHVSEEEDSDNAKESGEDDEEEEENKSSENNETEQTETEKDQSEGSDDEKSKENVEDEIKLENGDSENFTAEDDKVLIKQNGEVKDDAVNGDSQGVEVCDKCGIEGTLLCCDNCPEMYHLECANPPLRRVPRGEWFCYKCKSSKKKEDTDNSRRSIRRDDLPLNNVQLQEVLSEVMKQEFAWPFLRPVNKNEVPDYYDIIANPMDFGTVKYKLNMGTYKYDADLMLDVALVFKNCNLYNNSEDEVYKCGIKMLQYFVNKCQELGLHVPHTLESGEVFTENNHLSTKSDIDELSKMEVE